MLRLPIDKKVVVSLLALALSPLAAEGAYRVWLRVQGEPFDKAAQRRRFETAREAALGHFSGETGDVAGRMGQQVSTNHARHPYLAFDKPTGVQQLEHDLERAGRAGPERYAVMILGGSVAAGFCNMGTERMIAVLGRDPRFEGRRIDVLGYGVAAFKEPQQLLQLAYVLSVGLDIDAVINLDGFGEVAIANANAARGINPIYPRAAQWMRMATDWTVDPECFRLAARLHVLNQRIVATVDDTLASPLRWSAIFGRQASGRLGRLRLDVAESQVEFVSRTRDIAASKDSGVTGPSFDRSGDAPILSAVRTWMESSFLIHSLCVARGIEYLHVLQPTLLDSGSKVPTPEEAAGAIVGPHWLRGVEVGYPLLRHAGSELEERGVNFFDASGVFCGVEERIYRDAVHFGKRGNEILAEAIGQAFLDGM